MAVGLDLFRLRANPLRSLGLWKPLYLKSLMLLGTKIALVTILMTPARAKSLPSQLAMPG